VQVASKQFLKFLAVGLLNTAFGYGVFAVFLAINLHYSAALALSTILGVLFNFKTIGTLVFSSHDNRKIFRFVAVYFFVYFLNVAGIGFFESNGYSPFLSGAILLPIRAVLSFILLKKMVFSNG